jgi:hypothetical protein
MGGHAVIAGHPTCKLSTEPRGLAQARHGQLRSGRRVSARTASKEWGRSRLPAEAAESAIEVEK